MKETSIWDNLINRYSFNFLGIYCVEILIPIIILLPSKIFSTLVQHYIPDSVIFTKQSFGPIYLKWFIDNCIFSNIGLIPPYCLISSILSILIIFAIIGVYKLFKKNIIYYNILPLIYIVTLYTILLLLIVNTQINVLRYPSSIGALGIYIPFIMYPITILTLLIISMILFCFEFNKNFRIKNKFILKNKTYGKIIGISIYLTILTIFIGIAVF